MPILLNWIPSAAPKTANRIDIGLELSGEDDTLPAVSDGRVKLVEIPAPSSQGKAAGSSEGTADRLIATFHGKFHRDPKAPKATRLTFEIFVGKATVPAHDQTVQGFDPECMFGVDAFVLTFVNREFIVWFPFHVDVREGKFLEIQAIAEIDIAGGGTKELGKSMVLNLGIRRTHAVDTTSILPGGANLAYTGDLVGHIILFHEAYLLPGGIRSAVQPDPDIIALDPAMIPVPASGSQLKFQAYVSANMHIVLMVDLLDDLSPPDSFLTGNIGGVTDPAPVKKATIARFKSALPPALTDVFVDAGFAGCDVRWSDDAAAAALVAAFKGAFTLRTAGWKLSSAGSPLNTSFWNFFVASGQIGTAGSGEQFQTQNTPTTVGGKSVFLKNTVPLGSGTKPLTKPIEIATAVFQDLLMTRSGLSRKYKDIAEYNGAVDKVAGKLTVLIAHEVAHSLGMMHHCKVENSGNYSEQFGSPVLSTMSSGVESGGFGVGMKFHSQAKVIWSSAFGVTPTFSDAFLQNKSWTPAEVFTLDWTSRMTRFIRSHGEGSVASPGLGTTLGTNPPFTTDPPAAPQRGTFVP
ncbi:MAG: hypothetical protein ACR2I2_01370 [Bryobacteraceae bacterium]